MRPGDTVTLAALLFFVLAGWLRRISPKQQRQIAGLGLLGAALIAATHVLSMQSSAAARVVGDWLPCLLILIVYWQAGRFGMPHGKVSNRSSQTLQAWLMEFDRRWLGTFLDRWAARWSTTWIGTYFELAYLLCYALIPCGVGVLYWAHQRGAIDQYWAVVLVASYLCYGIVPFAQTLPPRLLPVAGSAPSAKPRPKSKIRSFNLFILRHASIHLNTFPSAHVASTVGASLVLMQYVPAAGLLFLLIALSIAAGAVLGRYHYALDVILGAMLPLCICWPARFIR
jgi:membrane-associated phospholipid phosphatase